MEMVQIRSMMRNKRNEARVLIEKSQQKQNHLFVLLYYIVSRDLWDVLY